MDRPATPRMPTWNHDVLEEGLDGARALSIDVADRLARAGWEHLPSVCMIPARRWRAHHPLDGMPLIAMVDGRAAYDLSGWARCVSLVPGAVALPDRTASEFGIARAELQPPPGAPGRLRDLLRTRRRRASMRRGERTLAAAIARRDHALALQVDAARAPGSDDTPFAELPAYALAARLDALLGFDPTAEVAVRIDLASATAMSELSSALEQRGVDAATTVSLASGGGAWLGTHVEALEQVARAAPDVREHQLDAWLEGIHGWHALREQLVEEPPLRERRDLVRSWIEQPLPDATRREQAGDELDSDLRPLVDRARELTALRERAARQRGLVLAAVRAVTWTLADRLAADGTLDHADEAFDRSLDELLALARGGSGSSAARTLAHDRAPGALDPAPTTNGVLQGMAASVGTAHGPVVVLDDPADAGDVTGAILVCRSTDPGWMPHLLRCAGLVTERGGPLSHGAIVARELGIPAVVAVRGARAAARSCATATIDGTRGTVAFDGTP